MKKHKVLFLHFDNSKMVSQIEIWAQIGHKYIICKYISQEVQLRVGHGGVRKILDHIQFRSYPSIQKQRKIAMSERQGQAGKERRFAPVLSRAACCLSKVLIYQGCKSYIEQEDILHPGVHWTLCVAPLTCRPADKYRRVFLASSAIVDMRQENAHLLSAHQQFPPVSVRSN